MDDTSAWDEHDRRVRRSVEKAAAIYVEGGLQALLAEAATAYVMREQIRHLAYELSSLSERTSWSLVAEANEWVEKHRTDRPK